MSARTGPLGLALRSLLGSLWFACVFFVAAPWGLLVVVGEPLAWGPPALAAGGALLVLAAHGVLLQLVVQFIREGRGTHVPLQPPSHFVARGLYRRVRNPMYLVYVAIIVGEAMLLGSAVVLAYAFAFFALEHWYVVGVEEPGLRRRFGDAYARYCAEVPRWLPRGAGGG